MSKAGTRRSAVDWALQYLWNLPEVSLVLSGMSSQKQLDENVISAGRSGISSLSEEDERVIQKLVGDPARLNEDKTNGNAAVCTDCQVCVEKCPQGINIPEELKKVDLVLAQGKSLKEVYHLE